MSQAPLTDRPIHFRGVLSFDDWQLKLYSIVFAGNRDSDSVWAAARVVIESELARVDDGYRLGFVTLHFGEHANWLLIDWWTDEIILNQKMFKADLESPEEFHPVDDVPYIGCVYELQVTAFEIAAWPNCLQNGVPDSEQYLGQTYSVSG